MSTLDKILTFIAACVGAVAAVDPFGFPNWVQGVAVVLTVGFAAIGIYTPSPIGSGPRNPVRRTKLYRPEHYFRRL